MAKCSLKIKLSGLKRRAGFLLAGSPEVPEQIAATGVSFLAIIAEKAATAPALSPWTESLPNQQRVKMNVTFDMVDTPLTDGLDPDDVLGEMTVMVTLGIADEALAEIGDPSSAFNAVVSAILSSTNEAFVELGSDGTDYLDYLGVTDPVEQITFTRRFTVNQHL